MEKRDGGFGDPADAAEPRSVGLSAARDPRSDAPFVEPSAVDVVVVPAAGGRKVSRASSTPLMKVTHTRVAASTSASTASRLVASRTSEVAKGISSSTRQGDEQKRRRRGQRSGRRRAMKW